MKKLKFLSTLCFSLFLLINTSSVTAEGNKPTNMIYMIGDGMGVGQLEIARELEKGKEGQLFLTSLPFSALVQTYSANRVVTDSAAAGTALATGNKTNNEMIGVTPDGKEVKSILDLFKEQEKKTGIISTNAITDATPAAFTASVLNRWADQADIAQQQLTLSPDVMLGGGDVFYGPALLEKAKELGYTIVRNRHDLLSNQEGDKLLGLFAPYHLSFKIDRKYTDGNEPSLSEMTKTALQRLDNANGFFLMVEGARIDHAAHSADIASVWRETVEFDEAVKTAVEWAQNRSDTLIVVVADHETMGISATEPLKRKMIKKMQASPEYVLSQTKKGEDGNFITSHLVDNLFKYTGIVLTAEEGEQLNVRLMNARGKVYKKNKAAWELGSFISERYNTGIVNQHIRGMSSAGGHTANPVPLFAYGAGAEHFHGMLDNTDIPKKMAELMDYHWN
ncbi:alkaline phosphatase [Cytobacillus sp. FSL K6-0265]|uniref:alkaline phosphatase n=1 Tax=Cytobacillus sp. FSL K6-0265 TaxID=2921448 RepID=UPI0030F6828E